MKSMKFKDYLILPALCMYIIYTSCAFVAKPCAEAKNAVPAAVVNPADICWGSAEGMRGEIWCCDASSECFYVDGCEDGGRVRFANAAMRGAETAEAGIVFSGMHMKCSGSNGRNYDFIFPDDLTAYDCNSGNCFRRGDYSGLMSRITSGKFVCAGNPDDWYVFKASGKSVEHFGDRVFRGSWKLVTSESLAFSDGSTRENFSFILLKDFRGDISGFSFNGNEYYLET